MTNSAIDNESARRRILLFSQRNIFEGTLFRCPHYEFEDIICQIDSVEVLAPRPVGWFKHGTRFANRLASDTSFAINPGIPITKLKHNYDLLFTVCGFPKDLLNFNTVSNWKDYCKTSICLIDEIWANQLPKYDCYLKILAKFDYVMLYYSQSVKPVSEVIGDKCFFLPPGVDALRFCPYPEPPKRGVDVYSIGRRSAVTHQALLRMADENRIFYVYDSTMGADAINRKEHRLLIANMTKRSKYFIVNPGLIDKPEIRGNQLEIGNRYFEGAAAGAIMIGEYPRNGEFEKLFNWPDAVIHLPFDSDNISKIINEFDKQTERKEKIRRNSVMQSLLRHDWVYRWEAVLKTAGLEPMPELFQRKKHLKDLSTKLENGHDGLPTTP
jgi:hypothetical protein